MTKIFIKKNNIIINNINRDKYLNIITCTYHRPPRLKYLNHLKELLCKESKIRWFVIDDAKSEDIDLKNFLPNFAIYLHIGPTRDKGHAQRNLALEYIYDNKLDGLIYNADDDNRYDVKIFDELRRTDKFAFLPVGGDIIGVDGTPERPIISKTGKFIRWNSYWQRKYSIDMGGFCFDSSLLSELKKPFWIHHGAGGETEFIDKLIRSPKEAQFLCDNCTKAYCFHNELLRTVK